MSKIIEKVFLTIFILGISFVILKLVVFDFIIKTFID